jgi:hypothetical protein
MKAKKFLLIPLLLVLAGTFLYFTFIEKTEEEKKEAESVEVEIKEVITDEEMLKILRLDTTGLAFLEKHDNFQVSIKELLDKKKIEERKETGDFKEIFTPLLIEDERYLKVRLDDWEGGRGIVGTIDLKTNKPVIVHNLFLARI